MLAGHDHTTARTMHPFNDPVHGSDDDKFHLHRFKDDNSFTSAHPLSGFDCNLPDTCCHWRTDGLTAMGNVRRNKPALAVLSGDEHLGCAGRRPTLTLLQECRLLLF